MPRSKEIKEQIRYKIVDMYQSVKGYKAISKALGLQKTTVRAITHKWRKLGTVVNLPRSGRPTKITPRAQWRLIQEVIKEPRTTSKDLQVSLASIKVSVHDSTKRKRLGKNVIHGSVPRQKPLLTKKNTKARHIFSKKHLDYPQDFGQIFCGLKRQKFNFLEGVCPVTSGVKPTQDFIKRTSYQQSDMVWCSVMVWGCFAASEPGWPIIDGTMYYSLSENPEGECPAVSLWRLAEWRVAELKQFCKEEGAKIHPQRCERLIACYHKRLIVVVAAKGDTTFYFHVEPIRFGQLFFP